jgi:hypothetical protein
MLATIGFARRHAAGPGVNDAAVVRLSRCRSVTVGQAIAAGRLRLLARILARAAGTAPGGASPRRVAH